MSYCEREMEKLNDWLWKDYLEVGSTNDEAKNLTNDSTGNKYVITAQSQTNGRGRRGRSWISLDGNLFMSMAIKVELKDLGQIIFIVSLSLLETLRRLFPSINVCLKWPNDVLVNEQKVSGILLEKGEGEYLVIGVGVNIVASPKIEGLIYPALSLHDAGYSTDRISLLKAYLQTFDANWKIWKEKGFENVKQRWLDNAKGCGQKILVHTEKGDKAGIFSGVDNNGTLLLQIDDEIEKIYAGDIFYL